MALTITKRRDVGVGGVAFVVADVTGDASYATGGYALQPSDLGLRDIDWLTARPMGGGGRYAEYDYGQPTGKLKLFTGFGAEVANAANESATVVRVIAIGPHA